MEKIFRFLKRTNFSKQFFELFIGIHLHFLFYYLNKKRVIMTLPEHSHYVLE